MLDLKGVTYHVGGRLLFKDVTLNIPRGHKAALVGRNGSGKSTLFRIILGRLTPDKGEVTFARGDTVGTVDQETPFGTQTPLDFLLASHKELADLTQRAETETDPMEIAAIHVRLSEIDAYDAEARAAKILKGLGFSEDDQGTPLSDFSGGWRMRVALATVLFLAPDILLLDEPSNHLDLETTLWLTDYLKNYPGTILLISHDKHFINSVVDRIYYLNQQSITLYMGDYDTFQEKRFEQALTQQARADKQEAQKAHMKKFIDRFRASPSKARLVQSRLKSISRMEEIHLVAEDPSLSLSFPEPEHLSPPLITFDNVTLGYGDKAVLRSLNQRIDPDDRIALLGRNGNGKTTFAKAVAGTLAPLKGRMTRPPHLKVAFFQQHQIETLTPSQSAFDHMAELMRGKAPTDIRAFLGRFGFTREKADVKVELLSGGEKTRLMFALLSSLSPALLILDEPTNHLDVETRESLILAINAYQGAVMLITHDWDLLSLTSTQFWVVDQGHVKSFEGTLEDYQSQALGIMVSKSKKDQDRARTFKQEKQKKKKK